MSDPLSPYDPQFGAVPPPDTGVFDAPTVQICLNVKWAGFVDGVLGKLLNYNVWQGDAATQEAAVAEVQKLLIALMQRHPCAEEGMLSEITLAPINMTVGVGNALAQSIDAAQRNAIYWFQNPGIASQSLVAARYMAAGTWSYRFTTVKQAGSGILRMNLMVPGPTTVVTVDHDLYSAGTQRNQYVTGTFTLPTSSLHYIEFTTNGKHASSSGYVTMITCLEMWRTGD